MKDINRLTLICGGMNTGKTTLAEMLENYFTIHEGHSVLILDHLEAKQLSRVELLEHLEKFERVIVVSESSNLLRELSFFEHRLITCAVRI